MRISSIELQRRGLDAIMETQRRSSDAQLRMSSGNKYLKPSDNPVASAQIKLLQSNIKRTENFQENINNGRNAISLSESSMMQVSDITTRIETLSKQAINGTLTSQDRLNINAEIQSRLDELVGLANTKDSMGQYIYAGYKSSQKPFGVVNGQVAYSGDQGQRHLQVSPSTQIAISDSGFDIFMNVPNGNGTFVTTDGVVNNTGSGIIDVGGIKDSTAFVPDDYTISFVTNSGGNLGYTVVGANTGQVIPALPGTIPDDAPDYVPDTGICFNGIEVNVSGQPAVGDDFGVKPSQGQSIFDTLQNIIDAVNMPQTNQKEIADFNNIMKRNSEAANQFSINLSRHITKIGARDNVMDGEAKINESIIEQNTVTMSSIKDVDYPSAISDMKSNLTALDASQKSYMLLSQLSLFNYM